MFEQAYRDHRLTIRCAKCDRPCERYEATPTHDGRGWRIRVWCHGDRDEMTLTADFVHEMLNTRGAEGLSEGVAFQTERLTHG